MTERRYLPELPLGGDDGPPWSKGLMARALAATGLGEAGEAVMQAKGADELQSQKQEMRDHFADETALHGRVEPGGGIALPAAWPHSQVIPFVSNFCALALQQANNRICPRSRSGHVT